MDILIRIIVFLIGLSILGLLIVSFSRTAILNARKHDPINSFVTRITSFLIFRSPSSVRKGALGEKRQTTWFMPLYITLQLITWFLVGMIGFALLYWATGAEPTLWHSFVSSGSALSTLGFDTPSNTQGQVLAIAEGALGLIIMVFFLTFIPGYQSAIQDREMKAARFYRRAGRNLRPSGPDVLASEVHDNRAEWDESWEEWETWFREIRASHVLAPEVIYTPSNFPGQSWIACAGAILDAATIYTIAVDTRPLKPARLCLEEGIDMINDVSATVGFVSGKTTISMPELTQDQYDQMLIALAASGFDLVASSEDTWAIFSATRARYMAPLIYLAERTLTEDFLALVGSTKEFV